MGGDQELLARRQEHREFDHKYMQELFAGMDKAINVIENSMNC